MIELTCVIFYIAPKDDAGNEKDASGHRRQPQLGQDIIPFPDHQN